MTLSGLLTALLNTTGLLLLLTAGPLALLAFGKVPVSGNWQTATFRPAGTAPAPAATPEAVVQVYAARAFAWRGAFADHTWLAVKPAGADRYTRLEVIGWNLRRGLSTVSQSSQRPPDGEWFGAPARLLRDLRGPAAERVIAALPAAVAAYPYPDRYLAWPGPNSNTFVAHLGRQIPDLALVMPPQAVGKDYLPGEEVVARSPGGGWQVSLWGVAGLLAGAREGLEVNLLGLVFGLDPLRGGVSLPGVGRLALWPDPPELDRPAPAPHTLGS